MSDISYSHIPVLLAESIELLAIKPDGIYVDGTAGGGGHSFEIARRLTTGRLVAIDQDEAAVAAAGNRLSEFGERVIVVRENFRNMASVCAGLGISGVDGILLDLGVSSYQLDCAERGFSYISDAPLDMRMDTRKSLSAYDVVNTYPESELCRIIHEYGEERFAGRIAAAIVRARQKKEIRTTRELSELIFSAVPAKSGDGHPAKRTFQAIRIEVNDELGLLAPALKDAAGLLNPGGRIVVISFHSLEDRIVKETFASLAKGCTCPRDFPVCVCGKKPQVKIITSKPILPSEREQAENPRSKSAKLRAAEKPRSEK
jgi:16S rRNA (cytosine1402-N4)-methyltransferase